MYAWLAWKCFDCSKDLAKWKLENGRVICLHPIRGEWEDTCLLSKYNHRVHINWQWRVRSRCHVIVLMPLTKMNLHKVIFQNKSNSISATLCRKNSISLIWGGPSTVSSNKTVHKYKLIKQYYKGQLTQKTEQRHYSKSTDSSFRIASYSFQSLPQVPAGVTLLMQLETFCFFLLFRSEVHSWRCQVLSGQGDLRLFGIDHSEDSNLLLLHTLLFVWKCKCEQLKSPTQTGMCCQGCLIILWSAVSKENRSLLYCLWPNIIRYIV